MTQTLTTTPLPPPASTTTTLTRPFAAPPPLVAPEPEHCPGPESAAAGQADACAGCPNQSVCTAAAKDGPRGPDPDVAAVAARLAAVKRKLLVLSGKGGVGKSTFAALLALAFSSARGGPRAEDGAAREEGGGEEPTVGIVDTDLCGPSIPRMLLGALSTESTIHRSASGWTPVWASDSLAVMSIQFMLPDPDAAVIWRGAKKNGMIKRFLLDVDWGALDLLLFDTPPGTSDEHLSVQAFLKDAGVDGAVLVATPQEVALLDVRKEIDFCRKAGIKIVGVVENMAGFVCPNCDGESEIFIASTGGARKLCEDEGLPFLGSVPLDPRIGMACDYGENFLEAFPDSPAVRQIYKIVEEVGKRIDLPVRS